MFTYQISHDDEMAVLVVRGKTTMDDYQTSATQFFEEIKSHDTRKLLVDLREAKGWDSPEAESLAFTAWGQIRSIFDWIAVVSSNRSSDRVRKLLDYLSMTKVNVRWFASEHVEAATVWLHESGGETD